MYELTLEEINLKEKVLKEKTTHNELNYYYLHSPPKQMHVHPKLITKLKRYFIPAENEQSLASRSFVPKANN